MQPQLEATTAIQRSHPSIDGWFDYPVRAQPHHTDYAGVVWHGNYVAWMEEARVECLRSVGVDYADLVALGCTMPVVDLSIRYHQSVRMGETAIIKTRMSGLEGVRIKWDYQIQSPDEQVLYATAQVTLVAIDQEKGKIMRQLPATVKEALMKITGP